MRARRRFAAAAIALAAGLVLATTAACGGGGGGGDDGPGPAADGGRTVEIEMVDIGFEPEELTVAKGETVTFRFTNTGKVAHDAFVGGADAQADHAEEMGDDAGHHHGDDDAVTVDPGQTETLTYSFADAGKIEIGCHQPGHYDAGMKIDITVR